MKNIFMLILLIPLFALYANQSEYIKSFPEAGTGMERFVLNLPEQNNESTFRVELIIGKNVFTDNENNYFFNGTIEEGTVRGWGFTYYKLDSLGVMAGTMMAVNPNAPKTERFITLGGEPFLIQYNSKIPVVVYVPEGVVIKYRIWNAAQEIEVMTRG